MFADLHMHTRFSDGSDDARSFIENIKKSNVTVFALTDHDTVDGIEAIRAELSDSLHFITGVEFSCISPEGKCHILGLGIDPQNNLLCTSLAKGERVRQEKLAKRLVHLKENYGILFNEEEMAYIRAQNRVGKPHLANLLIRRGLATDLTDAIKKYIDLPESESDRIPTDEAIHAITAAGGIPVWAHPLGGEGEKRLTESAFHTFLTALIAYGIRGMECYYSRYSMESIEFLLHAANEHHLLISGGSDYHGTNKNIPIGELNSQKIPIEGENLTILKHLI